MVKEKLRMVSSVAVTSDNWTDEARTGYFSLTVHFFDDQWRYKCESNLEISFLHSLELLVLSLLPLLRLQNTKESLVKPEQSGSGADIV